MFTGNDVPRFLRLLLLLRRLGVQFIGAGLQLFSPTNFWFVRETDFFLDSILLDEYSV